MLRLSGIATLIFLIVAGVPWYWSFLPQSGNELWGGIPAWFVVSVSVSLMVSLLTAAQFLVPWESEREPVETQGTSDSSERTS